MTLKTVYLFGTRIGEVCGYVYPSEKDKVQPTGMLLWASLSEWQPNMTNYEEEWVLKAIALMDTGIEPSREEISKIREQAFVLSIITEKREGFNRQAAIPMRDYYERWSKEVYQHITERQDKGPLPHLKKLTEELTIQKGKPIGILTAMHTPEGESILENYEPIFPYKRQDVYPYAVKAFEGFTYPVTEYHRRKKDLMGNWITEIVDGKEKNVYELIPAHQKQFSDHALRHLRSTEFKTFFLIEGPPLDRFFGWTKPRGGETSAMQDRYVYEPWKAAGYFPRLLRRRA